MYSFYKNLSPVYRFLIHFGLLAIIWELLYVFILHGHTSIDITVVNATINVSKYILELLGYNVFTEYRVIRIAGTSGLWIGDNCDAIALFALFSGFILAFPGNLISKCWYIPLGIIALFLVNCLRMVLLAIMDTYSRTWTEFNHSYTFTILIYGFIVWLWFIWMNRFSVTTKNKTQ